MITTLIDLSLRGTLILLIVWSCNLLLGGGMTAQWRRLWWLLVPLAFLSPLRLPVLPEAVAASAPLPWPMETMAAPSPGADDAVAEDAPVAPPIPWLQILWFSGFAISVLAVLIPTFRAWRQWSRLRLSTDTALLNLLEDCKATAGVTVPFGLVVSEQVTTPALLGWLRPRILLPASLAGGTRTDLQAIFLHELAHFKMGDIPLNWLFALTRSVHWFNPLAWLAGVAWARFREEAADEQAIRWLGETTSIAYGESVIRTLGNCSGGLAPCGALALGESVHHLKRRILMIRHYPTKIQRGWLASAVILILAALMTVSPSLAGDDLAAATKKESDIAVKAMESWLDGIDAGGYAQSWTDAAKSFQTALSSEKWVEALTAARKPQGKMLERKLASAMYQNGIVAGTTTIPGQFVIAQFDTSFENLKYARETVTFEKDTDGKWKAAGYYIKPR